jgi:hypothetical protein
MEETLLVSKKRSMTSKIPEQAIALKISWGLPISPKRLRYLGSLVKKITRQS